MKVEGGWFRHHDPDLPADRPTTRGWRWNPAGVPTLYLASTSEGCRREFLRLIERAALRPEELLPRALTRFAVYLRDVEALRSEAELKSRGLRPADVESVRFERCQKAAGPIAREGREGIVARSAVDAGETLAVFVDNVAAPSRVEPRRTILKERPTHW